MEFIEETNRIYLNNEEGKLIAEITFPNITESSVNINHTYVHESLRGGGMAGKLLLAAYNKIKSENMKVVPTCSYAVAWFKRHPEYNDILDS